MQEFNIKLRFALFVNRKTKSQTKFSRTIENICQTVYQVTIIYLKSVSKLYCFATGLNTFSSIERTSLDDHYTGR